VGEGGGGENVANVARKECLSPFPSYGGRKAIFLALSGILHSAWPGLVWRLVRIGHATASHARTLLHDLLHALKLVISFTD